MATLNCRYATGSQKLLTSVSYDLLRVAVGGGFADEGVEGLVAFAGEFDGEGGGGGDGDDGGDAGGKGFLHDFEGGSTADAEDLVGEGVSVI